MSGSDRPDPVGESADATKANGGTPDPTRPDQAQPQGAQDGGPPTPTAAGTPEASPSQRAEGGAAGDAGSSDGTESPGASGDAESPGPSDDVDELYGCPVVDSLGATVVLSDRERYLPLMEGLRADGFDMPVGVLGVDYLTHPGRDLPAGVAPERFEVVVELVSIAHNRRIRVRCQVPESDPSVPTLFDIWPGTEAHEREVYDMYGIRFDGHPDPTRILMPEDWEGHPLRKDYATGHVAVQFKEAPGAG